MKKYEKIVKRVEFLEEKHGIKYAKTDGKLYNTLKVFYFISMIYTLGINLLFMISMIFVNMENEKFILDKNSMITVGCCTSVLIAGLIFSFIKFNITSSVLSIIPLPMMFFCFSVLMRDSLGYFGYKLSFYWRHAIPIVILCALSVWMLIIALRAKIKFEKQYKKTFENVYEIYRSQTGSGDMSAEQTKWEEFLETYNPRENKEN